MTRLLAFFIIICVIQKNQAANVSNSKSGITDDDTVAYSDVIDNIKSLWRHIRFDSENDFNNTLDRIQKVTLELDNMKKYYDEIEKEFHMQILEAKYVAQMETRYKKFKKYLWSICTDDIMNKSIVTKVIKYTKKNQKDLAVLNKEVTTPYNKYKWLMIPSEKKDPYICDYNYFILKLHIYAYQRIVILTLETYLIDTFALLLDGFHSESNISRDYGMIQYDNKNVTWPAYDHIAHRNKKIKQYVKASSAEVFQCTSREPIRGNETVELEGIVQKLIVIEPDMDQRGTCYYATCPIQLDNKLHFEFPLKGDHRTKPCHGEIWECDAVQNIEICYANELISKRYEGFKFNGRIYGDISSCPNGMSTIRSWRRWIFFKCDVCLCTCVATDGDTTQTQAINYAEQTSDIENNMVVTNVRFVEKNKTIHIQIEEEQLSLLAYSNNDSLKENWKPITDVHPMQVRHLQRILELDDIIVPSGHVVTGVKFGADHPSRGLIDGSYHKFQIHVRATPYNFMRNKLIISQSGKDTSFWVTPQWMKNTIPAYKRERSPLHPFDTEDHAPLLKLNIKNSEPNQYISFRSSDLQDDAGQSTIPFFDSRPPFSKRPFPLSGIGISLKSYGGVNGYLTFKTFPYFHDPIENKWLIG